MDDDFNTPEAMAVLFELAAEANRSKSALSSGLLRALGGILGLLGQDPTEFLQGRATAISPAHGAAGLQGDAAQVRSGPGEDKIQELIEARAAAKKAKNYAEADRIRKDLLDAGIVLEDTPQGTGWRRA